MDAGIIIDQFLETTMVAWNANGLKEKMAELVQYVLDLDADLVLIGGPGMGLKRRWRSWSKLQGLSSQPSFRAWPRRTRRHQEASRHSPLPVPGLRSLKAFGIQIQTMNTKKRLRKTTKGFQESKQAHIEKAEQIQRAVLAITQDHLKLRDAARRFHVSKSTLHRYITKYNNTNDDIKASFNFKRNHGFSTVFSEEEEQLLSEYLKNASHMCYGMSANETRWFAYRFAVANEKIVPNSWHKNNLAAAGEECVIEKYGFTVRQILNCDETSKYNVSIFFNNLRSVIEKYGFTVRQILNCDETSVTTVHRPPKVVAPCGQRQVGKVTSAKRGTLVTMCATNCANGTYVPPFFIFPRKNLKPHMLNGAPPGSKGAAHPSGWMTGTNFVKPHMLNGAPPGSKGLVECKHIIHAKCFELSEAIIERVATCPVCRTNVLDQKDILRKVYRRYNNQDRERVVASANRRKNWTALAISLGVHYKTGCHWINSEREKMLAKGGYKPKMLSEKEINTILSWLEDNCTLTLKLIKTKVLQEFHKGTCTSTIGNYLEGSMYSFKNVHKQSINMNSLKNKQKRADYVTALNNLVQAGKQIVWIDETNFNLFGRRSKGRSTKGARAVQVLPAARGPNIHLIGAVSAAGVRSMERRRGLFTTESANCWMTTVFRHWEEIDGNGHAPRQDPNRIELSSPQGHTHIDNGQQAGKSLSQPGRSQRPRITPQAPTGNLSDQTPTSRGNKIPPIVLRDKSGWCGISAEIRRRGHNFTKAQNIAYGIRVFPATVADFRGIAKFFKNDNIPFHTYQLPSEKVLNVVIRGIPFEIPEDQILKGLQELGFNPDSVARMRRGRGGASMPLILVKISKDQKTI
ncbi:hypothetical protein QE152_g24360 [Popillia japonica]|uniref:HTH psq-type domain-containing protein n=1 Tax=Popillia japonica TaxID=7064 RepID=A0AAW1KFI7_POPJA